MEESKRQLQAEGRAAEKRGAVKEAGDLYARAGAHEDAARVYFAGGCFVEAGKSLMQLSGYGSSRSAPNDASRKSLLLKAAICFSRGGDIARAVELFVACGERSRAVELLRSVGDMANAARVEADQGATGERAAGGAPPRGDGQAGSGARGLCQPRAMAGCRATRPRAPQVGSGGGVFRRGQHAIRGGGVLRRHSQARRDARQPVARDSHAPALP
jgi:hypothetical protein